MKLLRTIVLLLATVGCSQYSSECLQGGGRCMASPANFAVDLPQGWINYTSPMVAGGDRWIWWGQDYQITNLVRTELQRRRELGWDVLRISRDGLLLQEIAMGRIPAELVLRGTKQTSAQSRRPEEAAEFVIETVRSNPNLSDQKIIDNSPAIIDGTPGFKISFTYKTNAGLTIKHVFYGAMRGDWLYFLQYDAPERYYFAKDLPVFEKVKESFKFLDRDAG